MNNRLEQLDSLRGLAALTVLFSHLVLSIDLITNGGLLLKRIDNSPLHIFYAGHEAVLFFFVLSGFVLTLPFTRGRKIDYSNFIIKRILRIYLPVYSMFIFAFIGMYFVGKFGGREVSEWIGNMWQNNLSFANILDHMLLIGMYDYNSINPVIWSLVHEMRISLIFPLVLLFTLRFDWKIVVVVSILLSGIGAVIFIMLGGMGHTNFGLTVHYTSMFIIGSLLAKNKDFIISFIRGMNKGLVPSLFGIAILFYTYPFWFFRDALAFHIFLIDDWAATIGACLFIMLALSIKTLSDVLKSRPINFLGKISFSLYLFHMIIIVVLFNLLSGLVSNWLLVILSIVLSIAISYLNYITVEKYSMNIGKKMVNFKYRQVNKKIPQKRGI